MKKISLKNIKISEKFKIILTLFSFAVTQPLFDVLNKNQEFFIVSNFSALKLLSFSLILAFIIPFTLYLIIYIFTKTYKPLGIFIYLLLIFILFTLFSMIIFNKISFFSDFKLVIFAVLVSLFFTILLINLSNVKKIISFLSLSSILFCSIFLYQNKLFSGMTKSIFVKDVKNDFEINNPHPIFIILFDEFPINSLLDSEGNIDEVLFPNYASLLNGFTWYKNATTVAAHTVTSLPAILTGNYPKENSLPTIDFYPNNIFNVLKNYYQLYSDEPFTNLCPHNTCKSSQGGSFNSIKIFLSDLTLIYKHLFFPNRYKNISLFDENKWNNFKSEPLEFESVEAKQNIASKNYLYRDSFFFSFLNSIKEESNPVLYFHHLEMPHVPFNFLPSGKIYKIDASVLGLANELWGEDAWLVKQNYQKHLLQVGFTDKLIGEFIKKIKEVDMYEESMIVIVADHGASYKPSDKRRALTNTNFQDIASIPLFIKMPNQNEGTISEAYAKTVDIFPTIIDSIELSKKFYGDGCSLLEEICRKKDRDIIVYYNNAKDSMLLNRAELENKRLDFLRSKYTNNNGFLGFNKIYKIGDYSEIIGEPIKKFLVKDTDNISISIDNDDLYKEVNLSSFFIPSLISGYVNHINNDKAILKLAIELNGLIAATTQTTQLDNNRFFWSCIVDENSIQQGKNEINVYEIAEENSQIVLKRLIKENKISYSLVNEQELVTVKNETNDKTFKLINDISAGTIDVISLDQDILKVSGWAVDPINKDSAEQVILFINGEFVSSSKIFSNRPDVVKVFGIDSYLYSGYNFAIPFKNTDNKQLDVKVFVIIKDNSVIEIH